METWSRQSQLTLVVTPNASYWARRHTEDVLRAWDAEALLRDAQLVISELVTNAVKATSTLDAYTQEIYAKEPQSIPYGMLTELACVRLRLSYGERRLLVEVWDESEQAPEERLPDFESEGGRGLFVVSAFCEKWGWYPAEGGGKVVWAELGAQS